ncbi:MAG: lysozyme [Proteobacteria bacterium]|nr:lysozyme [Pseudomonadota bacterium]
MATATKPAIVTGLVAAMAIAGSLITAFEGVRYRAYADGVGVWTICEGHTKGVRKGDTATPEQCKKYLREDMADAERIVTRCVARDLPPSVRGAFISLTFNTGGKAVCEGTPGRLARQGDFAGACHAIRLYNWAGGRVVRGLDRRRAAEEQACMRDVR